MIQKQKKKLISLKEKIQNLKIIFKDFTLIWSQNWDSFFKTIKMLSIFKKKFMERKDQQKNLK